MPGSGQPADPQIDGPLVVREDEGAFLVVREEDPEDWLARFEKGGGFPARAWAENMARVFNGRLSGRLEDPPVPPGDRPGSYHPELEASGFRRQATGAVVGAGSRTPHLKPESEGRRPEAP